MSRAVQARAPVRLPRERRERDIPAAARAVCAQADMGKGWVADTPGRQCAGEVRGG